MKKVSPKTKKLVKIIKGYCSVCNRNKSQHFTKQMTRGEEFVKNAKCIHGHRSAMSNSACCDQNKNCTVLKLHDMFHNPKCKCQKILTFSPNQFQLEDAGFENTIKKYLRDLKQLGIIF